MSSGEHWGNIPGGERVKHEGEKYDCAEPDCPQGQAVSPEGRVRLYVELSSKAEAVPLAAEFRHDERFRSPTWNSASYGLQSDDLCRVLDDLSMARHIRDANADRIDAERENVSAVCQVIGELGEEVTKKGKEIQALKDMVASLRRHGGEHWFAFGYQKVINLPTGSYVDHCSVCDKPKDDPSHFGNGVKAVSSKALGEALGTVQDRLVGLLASGMRMGQTPAQETAQELLAELAALMPRGKS